MLGSRDQTSEVRGQRSEIRHRKSVSQMSDIGKSEVSVRTDLRPLFSDIWFIEFIEFVGFFESLEFIGSIGFEGSNVRSRRSDVKKPEVRGQKSDIRNQRSDVSN